jgi:hypothetical protein
LAPFVLPKELQSTTLQWAGGYFLVALGLLLWAWYLKSTGQTEPDGHVDTAA